MIEEKAGGSVWNVALFAIFVFVVAITIESVFSPSNTPAITANAAATVQ